MYLWTDGSELYHHGIKGQRWGVRRFQNEDGSYTAAGKQRRGMHSKRSKEKIELSEKQKKYIKIGLIAGGAALALVGGYYLYKNGYINNIADIGKDALGGDAEDIAETGILQFSDKVKQISESTGIPLKDRLYSVTEDVDALASQSVRTSNDCAPLALNFAFRRMGLDSYSCGNDNSHLGGLSFNELGNYFRGISRASEVVKNGPSAKTAIKDIVAKQSQMQEGAVGLIFLNPIDPGDTGHFTSWVIENGHMKFPDVQTRSTDFIGTHIFDAFDSFRIVRLDNLEVNTKNLFGNPFDLDIEPIVKKLN